MRSLVLISAYVLGLVVLTGTLRRSAFQGFLVSAGLLLPAADVGLPRGTCVRGRRGIIQTKAARAEERGRSPLYRRRTPLPSQEAPIPFATGQVLGAGAGLRGCVGDCDGDCAPHYLSMGTDGVLALHPGGDASREPIWRAAARPWWRRSAVVADDYWAALEGGTLKVGRGQRTLLKRPLARCGPLAALLPAGEP